jgi:hypothetical protein
MERMIEVVNLRDGRVLERPSDTPTLDVPADFRRPDGVVSLDSSSHGRYIATDGKTREYSASLRPLSFRARGEECLIAETSGRSAAKTRNLYRLVAIEPL